MKRQCEYLNEKAMEAYEKYLQGEFFVKVRAIILKDDKVAFLKHQNTGYITVPGGSVEKGESLEEATIRETKEETGIIVKPITIVGKNYYDVPMQIGDVDFVSNRVEYFYICEYIGEESGHHGVDGEHGRMVDLYFDSIDRLVDCRGAKGAISKIKGY